MTPIKRIVFNPLNPIASCLLLIIVLSVFLSHNTTLCIESDGSTTFEKTLIGLCEQPHVSAEEGALSNTDTTPSTHRDCDDCTDISLSQTVTSKLKKKVKPHVVLNLLPVVVTSFETPIFTELLISLTPPPSFIPIPLHQHLQTIIFLI